MLLDSQKQTILSIPVPSTRRQFLRSAGFCRLWVSGFTEIAKPLYEATRGQEDKIERTPEMDTAFKSLRKTLLEASVLALPDIHKPFHLYEDERKSMSAHSNPRPMEKTCGLFTQEAKFNGSGMASLGKDCSCHSPDG